MTPEVEQDFESRVYAYVGRQVCPRQPAKDAVNAAMIRHWCEAMGETNPAYLDPDWAEHSRRGKLIAPPAMMYVWNQEGLVVATEGRPPDAQSDLVALFDQHGFFGTLGTDVVQEYHREVSPGDTVYMEMVIDNISEQKATARGTGYFFETLATFTDQHEEVIGTQRFRVLKFKPEPRESGGTEKATATAKEQAPAAKEKEPAAEEKAPLSVPEPNRKTLALDTIQVGDKLPTLDIPISTGLIVGAALATRDFERVHHDKDFAQATGLPDVFMNILTSQGLMTRFVTDWSGPEAIVNALAVRLGAPNLPGMTMTVTGEVTGVDSDARRVEIAVNGENDKWGMHMRGTVTISLPGD